MAFDEIRYKGKPIIRDPKDKNNWVLLDKETEEYWLSGKKISAQVIGYNKSASCSVTPISNVL